MSKRYVLNHMAPSFQDSRPVCVSYVGVSVYVSMSVCKRVLCLCMHVLTCVHGDGTVDEEDNF